MVYRRSRRTVVEDRNPMGIILAVLAFLIVLFLAWMLLFNDGFGGADDDRDNETTTEERGDTPDVNIEVPGGEGSRTGNEPATGDEPATGGEGTTGDQPGGGVVPTDGG